MTQEAKAAIPNARILLVDIETNTCELLQHLLSQHYEVEIVAEGGALIGVHQLKHIPDLVLADATMTELEGFEWLRSLRADPTRVPIILLSTQTEEEALVAGLTAGADDYVIKPFFAHEVLARIKVNLKLAQLRQQARRRERNLHAVKNASQEREQHLRLANERFELAAVAGNYMIYDWNVEQDTVETEGLTQILGYLLKDVEPTGN